MSFSYSGIVGAGSGKVTLPSVEGGMGSLSILRDPPKSIHTRRIDKVGETSSITELCDDSGNRACESINLYARGVNPMVSVSYSNVGNNGGQRSGGMTQGGVTQSFLPYTIIKDGAFRPPVMTQEQLMPLSRQPRINTQAFTQKGFVDFTKKMQCPGGTYKGVKLASQQLKACIRPTATFMIERPAVEPFEVKYVIKNPIKVSATSGVRTQDITTQEVYEPSKEINTTPLHANVHANYGSNGTVRHLDNTDMDTDRYLQDVLHSAVQSKLSHNIQITPIEDLFDVDIRTKDSMNISYTTPITGNTKEDHIHNDLEFQRRVIHAPASTNVSRNIHVRHDEQYQQSQERNRPITQAWANHGTSQHQVIDTNREFKLIPKISAGGFSGRGQMPMSNKTNDLHNFDSDRVKMGKKIMAMQQGRFLQ